MLNLALIRNQIERATGVLAMAYATIRDQQLTTTAEDDKRNFKLDDVMSDTITGLEAAMEEMEDAGPGVCDCCHSFRFNLIPIKNYRRDTSQNVCWECIVNGIERMEYERERDDE